MYVVPLYQYLLVLLNWCIVAELFVHSGEVKLTVDPEAHFRQFDRYMNKCEVLEDHKLVGPALYMQPELEYDSATSHGRPPFCNYRV